MYCCTAVLQYEEPKYEKYEPKYEKYEERKHYEEKPKYEEHKHYEEKPKYEEHKHYEEHKEEKYSSGPEEVGTLFEPSRAHQGLDLGVSIL